MWESKFYGAFVLNRRVVLHAIDAMPARWRGGAGSSPLDGASTAASSPRYGLVKNYRVHPTYWLISTKGSRIYAFLGVEAHATRPDLYARSMRKPLREYVENLDEVREALRGTPWAADPVLTTT